MAKIYNNLTELIGNTPLLEVKNIEKAESLKARLIVKLEYFNPGGSVKDRIALSMIEAAEQSGVLKPGQLIIEPTSGNTGIGLAWVASVKGYKLILTMPETMSVERQNLLIVAESDSKVNLAVLIGRHFRTAVDGDGFDTVLTLYHGLHESVKLRGAQTSLFVHTFVFDLVFQVVNISSHKIRIKLINRLSSERHREGVGKTPSSAILACLR